MSFDRLAENTRSRHYSVKYLLEYHHFLEQEGFGDFLNINKFKNDIEQGLLLETNIPISYGLGSSGAIVASIYHAYAKDPLSEPEELKKAFSKMESFYHGKSSGLDPLVSYLDKAILINQSGKLETVKIPAKTKNGEAFVFLLDTKTIGETQPLVNWFLNEYEKANFKNSIQEKFIPATNAGISNFLDGNPKALLQNVKVLSAFTYGNLEPMIPETVKEIWKKGLETNVYQLKLCGSGGGGMLLGFTADLEKTKANIQGFGIEVIHQF
jgi:mevalonate kinase